MKLQIGLLLSVVMLSCQQPNVKPEPVSEPEYVFSDTGGGPCQAGYLSLPNEEWQYPKGMTSPIWGNIGQPSDSLYHFPADTINLP